MRHLLKIYTEEDQAETARLSASPSLAYIPSPANDDSAHGAGSVPDWLAEARVELARAKAAAAPHPAENRPIPAPCLVTAAQGERAEVVTREEGSPSRTPSPSPAPAPAPTKPWEDTDDQERAIFDNRALTILGRPFAVSINFDPEIISKALNDNRGPLNYLRRQVLRHFKRALLSRPCWIKVETTKLGKIHVHIGMALRDSDDPQVFKIIAAQTGGNYKTKGSAPADVREMWFPDGWVGYVNKDDDRTRRHLREALGLEPEDRVPLYSATDDIRALAKELHQEARRATQEARRRPIVVEVPQTTSEAAAPVSEFLDASASTARPRSRPPAVLMMPLPIPVVAIRMPMIVLDGIWKASIGISVLLQDRSARAGNTRPCVTRASLLPVLAFRISPIVVGDQFQLPALARSRGPPRNKSTTKLNMAKLSWGQFATFDRYHAISSCYGFYS